MQIERIDEPIRVRADFQGGDLAPIYFQRGHYRYRVVKIHTKWIDREGIFPRIHFALDAEGEADSGTYELHFNTKELSWYLDSVALPGG